MEDSGVPVLFYRMANQIAKSNIKIQVSIIDYVDGVMWRNVLELPNIQKIEFVDDEILFPPENSVLVMQTFVPYYWPKELKLVPNQKLFFWNLHPQNLIPSLLPLPYLRDWPMNNFNVFRFVSKFYPKLINRLKKYTLTLINKKGLFFMDKSNLDTTSKYLSININEREFIPVPAECSYKIKNDEEIKVLGQDINFGWIGRFCDFKSYILIYSIMKLDEISSMFSDRNFKFHIVGSGPFETIIKEKVKSCKNISVEFYGSIEHTKIDNFIIQNIDILFAMGTSALEGAKLGIPTILVDPALQEVKGDYVFRMLFETTEYDLGHFVSNDDFVKGNTSLYQIVNNIISNFSEYSNKTSNYFYQNHDLENVKDLFIEKINKSNLLYSDIDQSAFKKSPILVLYNKIRGLDA